MPFDPRIFEYPAVQYIPLYPLTLALETDGHQGPGGEELVVLAADTAFHQELKRLDIPHPGPVDFQYELVLLAQGYHIKSAYYRAYSTIVLGEALADGYHLVAIPRSYFYKDRVHFALYDTDAKKVAWVNWQVTMAS